MSSFGIEIELPIAAEGLVISSFASSPLSILLAVFFLYILLLDPKLPAHHRSV
ncbi:hypothetical protein M430DRAFT_32578 [Amorphotheca resinae ATCC 22711]|uniref:Uncharacterized protein n=1 Tax=Amorphotheca resinae ATCC 22711 TaxID=857342 RepID=A0A2T3BF74_AMORE|nr:hypothetical protein M430DRAFT_32578 [Amorphotheca resinae ATCC 22711]PSS28070.1 hypothetical protein M430DRAFT_32578 [Amorphotheca resinae ATCC 22711]